MNLKAAQFASHVRVLSMGVDRCSSPDLAVLSYPAKTACAFVSAITLETGCAVPSEMVITLTNDKANREAALSALDHLTSIANEDDLLIILFSGHGVAKGDRFFLCTSGAHTDRLYDTAISDQDLEEALKNSRARGIFFLLDCCHGALFAELAPSVFRKLGRADFRIVLSAARSEEPSWEYEKFGGSILMRHLIRIVTGEEQIGSTPGLVYFSEVFGHLQKQLAEDVEQLGHGAPPQELVFQGVYSNDPLLFVHRGLTLQQISVRTLRYSRAYVRRMIRRLLLAVTVGLGFAMALWYVILDHHEYVVAGTDGLVINRGLPHWNALLFPKPQWTLAVNAEQTIATSPLRSGNALIAPLDHPVMPLVLEQLKPEFRALVLHWQDEDSSAREILVDQAKSGRLSPFGLSLFATLANSQDTQILEQFLTNENDSSRVAAIVALFRVAPRLAATAIHQMAPETLAEVRPDVLRRLTGPCGTETQEFLAEAFAKDHSGQLQPAVIGKALELQCPISESILLAGIERAQPVYSEEIGRYGSLKYGDRFASDLEHILARQISQGRSVLATLDALRVLPRVGCSPELWILAGGKDREERYYAIRAIFAQCEHPEADPRFHRLASTIDKDPAAQAVLVLHGEVDPAILLPHLAPGTEVATNTAILQALGECSFSPAIPRVLSFLHMDGVESVNQIDGVHALRRMHAHSEDVMFLLGSAWTEVKREVLLWYRDEHPREAVKLMFGYFEDPTMEVIADVMGTTRLSPSEVALLQSLLHGSLTEKENAAAVLAMQGTTEDVFALLTNSDSWTRRYAVDYVGARSDIDQTALAMSKRVSFPNDAISGLRSEADARHRLDAALGSVPLEHRGWVAKSMAASTRVSPGIALWLNSK